MKRFLKLFLIMAALLLVTNTLAAQKPAETFCGDLSTADCTLLTDAEAVMKNLQSHSFKLDTTLDVAGIPNMPSTISLHLAGDGSLIVDHKAMPETSGFDASSFAKDPKAIFDLISKAVSGVTADLKFTLDIPKELKPMMGNSDLPDTINLNLKLVDGTIYVNTAELAPLMPQAKSMPAWMGMNIPDLISAMLKQPGFEANMSSMSSGMNAGMNTDMMALFNDQELLSRFMHVKRLADATIGSTKVAVYETTLDYPALFATPEVQQMITSQMAQAGTKLSDKETKAVMDMLQELGKGMTFTMTRSIDLEQNYVVETDANLKVDLSSMKDQMGSAIVITFNMNMTQNDFDTVTAITAPKDGMVIPATSVFPSK